VEDNDMNRKIIQNMLKKIGIKIVDTAVNGLDALKKVKEKQGVFSMIFMDM
jgi:CheY-like chemotaxis protein